MGSKFQPITLTAIRSLVEFKQYVEKNSQLFWPRYQIILKSIYPLPATSTSISFVPTPISFYYIQCSTLSSTSKRSSSSVLTTSNNRSRSFIPLFRRSVNTISPCKQTVITHSPPNHSLTLSTSLPYLYLFTGNYSKLNIPCKRRSECDRLVHQVQGHAKPSWIISGVVSFCCLPTSRARRAPIKNRNARDKRQQQ